MLVMAAKKRGPGRPPKKPGEPRSVPLSVSLPEDEIKTLRRLAHKRGVAVSTLVQRAVKRWLKTKEAQNG